MRKREEIRIAKDKYLWAKDQFDEQRTEFKWARRRFEESKKTKRQRKTEWLDLCK